ncbi:MAG: DoxX family protein [Oceanipulchritudo sp.]
MIQIILQIVIALGIYNVWFLRFGKSTPWRGGTATNMKEEFAAYGLPEWSLYLIGFLKVLFATLLLVGLFVPIFVDPTAIGMAVLMAGAMLMHFKVGDPPKRALPSILMLFMSIVVVLL